MSDVIYADVVIVGGGASGIAAAIEVKRTAPQLSVVIAERLEKTGRKILATGNGRCNLGNRNASEKMYRGSVKNIGEILACISSIEDYFNELGVLCTSDEQGRMYPYSNSAATVLSALRIKLEELEIREVCGFRLMKIERSGKGYKLISESSIIECGRVIISAGGYAGPSFGTDGSLTGILRKMGYKTAKICPAVAPLRVRPDAVKGLRGVRVKGKIFAVSDEKILREEVGEIQFTENSVSGICVFNLAYFMAEYEGKLMLRADLMPDKSPKSVEEYIYRVQAQRSDRPLEELLTGAFVKNLAVYLVKNAVQRPLTDKILTLKYNEIHKLVQLIKYLEFEVTGASSWQNAQVTAGGIHGSNVDKFLESRTDRGLYFAGEILDVDGDCGGYNLQWAWCSGTWAGRNCAKSLLSGEIHGKNK